jgi:hypothetical protein
MPLSVATQITRRQADSRSHPELSYLSKPQNYHPLTSVEKFKMASQDALDPGTVALAALFAGENQLSNSNRAFGQGTAGFARYWGAGYGDLVIGDYMTEGVFPSLLHQDPRYFRRGTGGGWSRMVYAASPIFVTRRDAGGSQFNHSEMAGNSVSVALSKAYYVNGRSGSNAAPKLGAQLAVDLCGNVLKEFWPGLERKFRRKSCPPANRP